ncbi:MAG TPA: HNH endonuclease [Candidatus Aminicenantes bacterium]|nr:HNH endonuclease [Candidatus Aminicenantes bacterium]
MGKLRIRRSEKALKELQVEYGKRSGLKNRKKIKYKKVLCQYPELGYCWECTSHARSRGYPTIDRNGRHVGISRYIWEKHFGSIPKKLLVLHKCDSPACINPEHLFLGTHKDNMQDAARKGRLGRKKNIIRRERDGKSES